MASDLNGLEAGLRRDLALLGGDTPNWVVPRPGTDLDVLVVGGGQSGATLAFALRRAGVGRVLVIDAADPEQTGVWRTRARMRTLRTAKHIAGPELGLPALTFRAWFEARNGAAAYQALDKIPREVWDDYITWYRTVLHTDVRHHTRLTDIAPKGDDGLTVTLRDRAGESRRLNTRKVVLATGVDGLGRPEIPAVVAENIPASHFAHTHDDIDFGRLKGARIAVLGAASSAFDAAATALENGAASVDLYCRKPALASWCGQRLAEFPGVVEYFHLLPDLDRWRLIRGYRARGTAPIETVARATRFDAFSLHLGQPWRAAALVDDRVEIRTAERRDTADFVIVGTGYAVDLAAREELYSLARLIATWGDRFTPPPGEGDAALAAFPYLGRSLEFVEKRPGDAPWLRHVHAFSYGGVLSHGAHVGEIQSLRACVPAVVDAIARDLFVSDASAILARLYAPVIDNSVELAAAG